MKIFHLLVAFCTALLFISCQRELSVENNTSGKSAGSLKLSTTGDCLPSTLNGIYKATVPVSADNYIDVQIDVTTAGTYTISTDTLNGIVFSAKGVFNNTGINTVRLQAAGNPLMVATTVFSIRYGNNACNIPVNIISASTADAVFSYKTAADGSCSGAVLAGVYKITASADASNTVKLSVNVTTAGAYSISIPAVNGISFSGSGVFTNTGIQDLILTASGTPVAAGNFTISAGTGGSSCTFSIVVTGGGTTAAIYSLGGAGSNCTGITVAGTYMNGAAMTAANTAKIQVNVTATGTYAFNTTVVNGVSFTASGSFTVTGTQTVTLVASGTPAAAGVKSFPVTGGGSTCSFDVTFTSPVPPAVFTLAGAPGACTAPVINGTYTVGTSLTASNTVVIKVNVTTAGPYTITTNLSNGISFSTSGVFASTGTNIPVTLTGAGTPLLNTVTTLQPNMGTASCSFDVPVAAAAAGSGTYNCKIDGVYNSFTVMAGASTTDPIAGFDLNLSGYTVQPDNNNQPRLQIFINNNNGSAVKAGTYNEKGYLAANGYRIEIDLNIVNADQSVTIWNTSSNLISPNPPFTIVVTSITATRVKGTFSGKVTNVLEGSTGTKTITEGVFDLPVQ